MEAFEAKSESSGGEPATSTLSPEEIEARLPFATDPLERKELLAPYIGGLDPQLQQVAYSNSGDKGFLPPR